MNHVQRMNCETFRRFSFIWNISTKFLDFIFNKLESQLTVKERKADITPPGSLLYRSKPLQRQAFLRVCSAVHRAAYSERSQRPVARESGLSPLQNTCGTISSDANKQGRLGCDRSTSREGLPIGETSFPDGVSEFRFGEGLLQSLKFANAGQGALHTWVMWMSEGEIYPLLEPGIRSASDFHAAFEPRLVGQYACTFICFSANGPDGFYGY